MEAERSTLLSPMKVSFLQRLLAVWLFFTLLKVNCFCHGAEHGRVVVHYNQSFNHYTTADSNAAKSLSNKQTTSKGFNRQHQRNSVQFETPSDTSIHVSTRIAARRVLSAEETSSHPDVKVLGMALVTHHHNLPTAQKVPTIKTIYRGSSAEETASHPDVRVSGMALVRHHHNLPTAQKVPTIKTIYRGSRAEETASHPDVRASYSTLALTRDQNPHTVEIHSKPKGSEQIHRTKKIKTVQENKLIYLENNLKRSFKKRQKRESTSQLTCKFPSFLETSPLCLVSKLIPGKVCKWFHTRQDKTPLFPFPNIVPPYHNWELQGSAAQMRNMNNRYLFGCIQKYSNNHYLVKITGKFKEIGERYHHYTRFLCVKFVPRGLNVVQYMVSKSSNVSEDLHCDTQKLKYVEQVLIADKFRELPDCPRDLRGAFRITRVHDAVHNVTCHLSPLKASLLESDCVNKEGIYLDFSAFRGCDGFNNDTSGVMYARDIVYLRCYSASWKKGGWNYVVVKRDKTKKKIGYRNTEMFHCLRFKKDQITNNIKLFIYFDSLCGFSDSHIKNSTPYFVFDIVPLTSSLLSNAKKTELEQLRCDLPKAILGEWIEKSAYSGEQTIRIGKQNIELGQEGKYMCMQSDRGQGIKYLFPTSRCVKRTWMERRKVSHFNNSFMLISANLPIGCRPRFVGFSVLQSEATSSIHLTYRLSQSIALPMESIQDPMLFVQNSLPEKFCNKRHLFRLDPYPRWGRNIEKIAVRPNALESNQPLLDCRFQGPLPNMFSFSGKLRVNVINGGIKNSRCPGRINICSSPTQIHLQYDVTCRKKDASYGCLGKVWNTKQKRGQDHYLLQDLHTHQIYCARSSESGFEIVRAASMQCYEFYWGLAAFQQQFHEKIDILTEGFMECPTGSPGGATDATGAVLEGDVTDPNNTLVPLKNNTKIKAVSTSPNSIYRANILSLIITIWIWLEYLLL
ncbi:uncharacterized protein LOC116303269 [Actinia tenebrosa]|uniref:Uncharacterized protein LOC116303269 n=1 Tax=Actinia tenebrosa TaxID=6105 RepID=A0A6P8IQU5_ACTTE|nr:uncharacterized protein LOC116303269 [Actinia tenebrosa]